MLLVLGLVWGRTVATALFSPADPEDKELIQHGAAIYAAECAVCHGAGLEGQPAWREPLADGRLRAPPHDASGHTWHHGDAQLFEIVKHGGRSPRSDMPAFAARLSDEEIWATLAFIKSRWPSEIRARQPR